jgi:hypothetical protein
MVTIVDDMGIDPTASGQVARTRKVLIDSLQPPANGIHDPQVVSD